MSDLTFEDRDAIANVRFNEEEINDDDVKDEWDAESDEEQPVVQKAPAKAAAKPKKEVAPTVDLSGMTEKQKQEFLAKQEMEMFGADIAGHSGIQLGEINTVEDAVASGANVAKTIRKYMANKHYYELLSTLFQDCCTDMAPKDIRRLQSILKQKEEDIIKKENDAKKNKGKKKVPTLGSMKRDDLLEDYGGGGGGGDDGDDFM